MQKLVIALAVILGLNLLGSTFNFSIPVSYAQENPPPEKPEKPERPD